jgi:hypothetical protein
MAIEMAHNLAPLAARGEPSGVMRKLLVRLLRTARALVEMPAPRKKGARRPGSGA